MNPKNTLAVFQDPENPVATEVLAQAVLDVAEAAKKLLAGSLSDRAVYLLIHDFTGVPMKTIKQVLHGAADLSYYVKSGARKRS